MEYLAHHPITQTCCAVQIEDNRIAAVVPVSAQKTEYLLTPGFCDLQVNGGFGVDLNAPELSIEGVIELNRRLCQQGVTAWCPTIITASREQICRNLSIIHQACLADQLTAACVIGVHLEGPYLSPHEGARGAHPLEFVRPPDFDEFRMFQESAGGRIKIVTIAPELPQALPFIKILTEQGIMIALGHTLADQAQIAAAVKAGAHLATHLGNGLPANLNRHNNPFLNMLVNDDLFASVIFDGHHLPQNVRTLLARAKGIQRLLMISDATRLVGLPPGLYQESIGGAVELSPEGRLSLAGTPYLAGAAMTLFEDVIAMLKDDSFTLTELLNMSIYQPRAFLGVQQDSLVLLKHNSNAHQLDVILTSVNNSIIHHPKENPHDCCPDQAI